MQNGGNLDLGAKNPITQLCEVQFSGFCLAHPQQEFLIVALPPPQPAPGYSHATATLFRLSKHHLSISFLFESEEFTRKGVKILQYR